MQNNDPLLDNIINTTLQMAFSSSIIAFLFGTLIGLLVAFNDFPGKRIVVTFMRTLMGLPPVVVGIIVYVLFSGTGPFGNLRLIYSVKLMIIAQVVLITPIVAGMTETAISPIVKNALPSLKGMGANPFKRVFLIIGESKYQLIAEVGAVQIVGGNILYKTRVMTTAIALNYNTGDFSMAIALGFILLMISLCVNCVAALLQFGLKRRKHA